MNFEQNLSHGKIGESKIARWMIKKGFSILPVYEIEGGEYKGQVLYTPDGNLICPDMIAFMPNSTIVNWIEAKTKESCAYYIKTQSWVCGINLKHYQNYVSIIPLMPKNWKMHLYFLILSNKGADSTPDEMKGLSPTGLWGTDLRFIIGKEQVGTFADGKKMAFWSIDEFQKYADLGEINEA